MAAKQKFTNNPTPCTPKRAGNTIGLPETDVAHFIRCHLPSGQAVAADMWRAPCCMHSAGRCCRDVAYAIRYHFPIEQACAAEMWRMPFCMHGQCRPVLQRCGARCKLPSVQLTVERMFIACLSE